MFLFVYRNPGFPNELNIMQDDSRKCLIYVDRFSTKRENKDGMVVVLKKKMGKLRASFFVLRRKSYESSQTDIILIVVSSFPKVE